MSNAAQFTSEVDRRIGPEPYELVVELSLPEFIAIAETLEEALARVSDTDVQVVFEAA